MASNFGMEDGKYDTIRWGRERVGERGGGRGWPSRGAAGRIFHVLRRRRRWGCAGQKKCQPAG